MSRKIRRDGKARRNAGSEGSKKRMQSRKFKSGATHNKRNRTDRGTLAA